MVNANRIRMLKNFQLKFGVKSESELSQLFETMDTEEVNIIRARWGIDDGKYCPTYELLNKKLGISNSKVIYSQAIKNLKNARFVLMLTDYRDFPFHIASHLGILACTALHTQDCSISGKALWNCLQRLQPDTRNVLEERFGLLDSEIKNHAQIAFMYDMPLERVKNLEFIGLRQLNVWKSNFSD